MAQVEKVVAIGCSGCGALAALTLKKYYNSGTAGKRFVNKMRDSLYLLRRRNGRPLL